MANYGHIVTSIEYRVKSQSLLVCRDTYRPNTSSGNSHYASEERIERLLRIWDRHQFATMEGNLWCIVPHTTGWSISHHRDCCPF